MFQIAKGSGLFCDRVELPLAGSGAPPGFRWIPAQPPAQALVQLAAAIHDGAPFCLSDTDPAPATKLATSEFLTLTGGSTGAPKVIRRTQASWIASFEVNARRFGLAQRRGLAVLGHLSHSLALYGVLEGLHMGLPVHLLAGMTPAQQRHSLRAQRVEVLYATPSQLHALCAHRPRHLPDLRLILCGGGALDAPVRQAMQALCPTAQIHQFYGAAETSFVTLSDADTPEGSVGRAYDGVEIRLIQGEIWVRSPYLATEYLCPQRPLAQQDGFVQVGELGQMDDQGNLWITGRRSRQVNIADQLVSPEPVEAFVRAHPQGGACVVVPLPDPARGTRFALLLAGPPDPARASLLRQACIACFGPLIAPRRIRFVPAIPMLASGKPDLDLAAQCCADGP